MTAQAQSVTFIQDFDVRFGQPHPKLGFKFSSITKKWQVVEPYKGSTSNSKRQSDASLVSGASSQKQSQRGVIITSEDQQKLKLIDEQQALIDKQIESQALEKARVEAQCNLLKVQLSQVMDQLSQRLSQVQKLQVPSSQTAASGKEILIVDSDEQEQVSMDDGEIISPEKMRIQKRSEKEEEEDEWERELKEVLQPI